MARFGEKEEEKNHASHVMCCGSRVTYHLSVTLTATATDPPVICTVGWFEKTQKTIFLFFQNTKALLALLSSTRSLQSTEKQGLQTWTDRQVKDIATHRLNWPRDRFSENFSFVT